MIVNPKKIIDNGNVVARFKTKPIDLDKQMSPNGIDLRLYSVSQIIQEGIIGRDSRALSMYGNVETYADEYYFLKKGEAYVIEMYEKCIVPENTIALVMHRSTLNRCGCFITGSIYDAGYDGVIGATLRPSFDIRIQKEARVAQIIFMEADSYKIYDGIYKGETDHNDAKQRVDKE